MAGDPNHYLSGTIVGALRSDRHATNIVGYKYFMLGFREPHTASQEVSIKVIISDAIDAAMTGNGVRWVGNPSQDNPNTNVRVVFGHMWKLTTLDPEWRIEDVTEVHGDSVEQ
jgi:hypothetical protein